jgi:hypothetical protein
MAIFPHRNEPHEFFVLLAVVLAYQSRITARGLSADALAGSRAGLAVVLAFLP